MGVSRRLCACAALGVLGVGVSGVVAQRAGALGGWSAIDPVRAMDANAGGIVEREVVYRHNGEAFTGFYAYGDGIEGERPAVLIVHPWWGLGEYSKSRARELAGLGFAAFALDMYGTGVLVDTPEEAQALATGFYVDRGLMRSRAEAGLRAMLRQAEVDGDDVAMIGYCFGGTVSLELARAGADLDAVVSFHGGLSTPNPRDARNITGTVMVANGGADAFVSVEERNGFVKEMEDAGVDYMFVEHGGAVHSFTNMSANARGMDNVAYDADADRRSWRHMLLLLNEVFGDED